MNRIRDRPNALEPDQATSPGVPIPLRERKRDWLFIIMFTVFATTSFLIDTANMVGRPNPHSSIPMARMVYDSMVGIDPVLIANPRAVQISVGFASAVLFGIFYLVCVCMHSCRAANGSGCQHFSLLG
jgi:hypothetical protein